MQTIVYTKIIMMLPAIAVVHVQYCGPGLVEDIPEHKYCLAPVRLRCVW